MTQCPSSYHRWSFLGKWLTPIGFQSSFSWCTQYTPISSLACTILLVVWPALQRSSSRYVQWQLSASSYLNKAAFHTVNYIFMKHFLLCLLRILSLLIFLLLLWILLLKFFCWLLLTYFWCLLGEIRNKSFVTLFQINFQLKLFSSRLITIHTNDMLTVYIHVYLCPGAGLQDHMVALFLVF